MEGEAIGLLVLLLALIFGSRPNPSWKSECGCVTYWASGAAERDFGKTIECKTCRPILMESIERSKI